MFSPTIMLLIGGFTIASALSKTNIDRVLITRVLSVAGTRPSIVLLAFMAVSCFASMWIRFVGVSCWLKCDSNIDTLSTQ
jgi:phosphate transporter